MINISKLNTPSTLSILNGDITFDVEPITTASYYACESEARRRIDSLKDMIEDAAYLKASVQIVGFDLNDPMQRQGAFQLFLIQELAHRHITAWSGVALNDEGDPAELNRENIDAVMGHQLIGRMFFNELTLDMAARIRAKKDSGIDADGTLAKVPNTAKGVKS